MKKINIYRLVIKAKILSIIINLLGKGQATSLPGISVEKRYQKALSDLANDFEEIIFISGTNGKTTTRALLNHIYEQNGEVICSNKGGANLIRGIATSLLLNRNLVFKPKAKIGIFEVEEASLPILTKYIRPNKLLLTNIFRDQLDAYGEIDKTQKYFRESIKNILEKNGDNLELIINADDGMLVELANEFENLKVKAFSLKEQGEKIKYEKRPSSSLKHKNAELLTAAAINQQNLTLDFQVTYKKKEFEIFSLLSGLYNVYNILAAVSVTYPRFKNKAIEKIESFKPVFGRGEQISLNNQTLTLFLIKNPAGFNQVLDLLLENFKNTPINLAICINDKIADGKDVSWLWDVDLESFVQKQKIQSIYTSGTRGWDMLLRTEFTGFDVNKENYIEDLGELLKTIKSKSDFIILCTYTALLELRGIIEKETKISKINSSGN